MLQSGTSATSAGTSVSNEEEVRHWPLIVRLRRRTIVHERWDAYSWSIAELCSDRESGPDGRCRSREQLSLKQQVIDELISDFVSSGLSLELYRDERAAYRFNLGSADPRLFVVCNENDDSNMEPFLITASQDEAASYMDGGEEDVFSLSMPEAIQCWIEAFIARHGEPEIQAKKGKNRNHGGKGNKGSSDSNSNNNDAEASVAPAPAAPQESC
ncbi:MAG: DUF3305 domain-containing protein [Motiliproteus sp.]